MVQDAMRAMPGRGGLSLRAAFVSLILRAERSRAVSKDGPHAQGFIMTKSFRTLDDVDGEGANACCYASISTMPMEAGKVTDTTRLDRVAPTITEIAGKGGRVILLAHFGRPKGRDEKNSLKPVAAAPPT